MVNMELKTMKKIVPIFYLLISVNVIAQGNCAYKIDTAKILSNENLNNFLSKLQNDSFKVSYNKQDIPAFIKRQLNCLANNFSLANPNQKYQETDVVSGVFKLPERQLQFLAISKDIFVMTYLTGGRAVSGHLLFVKFQNKKIVDFWSGQCCCYKTIQEIIFYLQKSKEENWTLHTGGIFI